MYFEIEKYKKKYGEVKLKYALQRTEVSNILEEQGFEYVEEKNRYIKEINKKAYASVLLRDEMLLFELQNKSGESLVTDAYQYNTIGDFLNWFEIINNDLLENSIF